MTRVRPKVLACLSTLVLLLAGVSAGTAAQRSGQGDAERLERALVSGIAMGIPGLSVAIGVGDSVVWAGTAGYNDVLRRVPLEINVRFGVGSITKTFVARVILQLAQEGRLDLNQTAADYLDLEIIQEVPNTNQATLRQLLNHQAVSQPGNSKRSGFARGAVTR